MLVLTIFKHVLTKENRVISPAPDSPDGPLESSPFWSRVAESLEPERPSGVAPKTGDPLDQIAGRLGTAHTSHHQRPATIVKNGITPLNGILRELTN